MMALINDMKNEKEHPGQPKLVVSNNTKAKELLGWEPKVDIKEWLSS